MDECARDFDEIVKSADGRGQRRIQGLWSGLRRDDAEFALVLQLHLTVAPQAKIAETFDAAQFRQRLDSCAQYLVVDGQVVLATVVHGCPDHPRGLLPSRCQDGKDDRIEIGHGYGFWKLHVFPPQITADGGGLGRRTQFWMLRVDRTPASQNANQIVQVQNGLSEYLLLFFVEFKGGSGSLDRRARSSARSCRRIFIACILSMVDPRGFDGQMYWNKLRTL